MEAWAGKGKGQGWGQIPGGTAAGDVARGKGGGPTLASGFAAGDSVTCRVTANDGFEDGNTVEATVTISNTPPETTAPTLGPVPATTDTVLVCAPGVPSDADGDPDASTYAWTVNGVPAGEGSGLASGYVGGRLS